MGEHSDITTGSDRHRRGESIVELVRCGSRFEAEVIAKMLESNGIRTNVMGAASGWLPQIEFASGVQVQVFAGDLEHARELLAAEAEPPPP